MANTKQQSAEQRQRDIRATIIRQDMHGNTAEEGFAGGLRLAFSNGKALTILRDELQPAIIHEATIHGLKQKLVDAAAIARDTKTGRSATIEEKYAAVRAVYDRLLAGAWNEEREGGGAGSYLLRALCERKGIPATDEARVAAIKTWLDERTKEQRAALELNPAVKAIIDRMREEAAARKAGDVDSDELLDSMPE